MLSGVSVFSASLVCSSFGHKFSKAKRCIFITIFDYISCFPLCPAQHQPYCQLLYAVALSGESQQRTETRRATYEISICRTSDVHVCSFYGLVSYGPRGRGQFLTFTLTEFLCVSQSEQPFCSSWARSYCLDDFVRYTTVGSPSW